MNKICGYSCEHNKSGVCQISVCDKRLIMSDKTEIQTFTRYIDPTITELQQENKQLKEEIEEYKNPIKYFKYANKNITEENQQLKDNWNRLKEWLEEGKKVSSVQNNRIGYNFTTFILNKMQELEGSDSNE